MQFVESNFIGARALADVAEFAGQFQDVFAVHVFDDRNEQPALGINGIAEVVIAFENELIGRGVEAGVELREGFKRGDDGF